MARKIDEDFAKAPATWVFAEKLWTVSAEAFRKWAMMTAYAAGQHTDGYVNDFNARKLFEMTAEHAKELIDVGLMEKADGGYVVRSHDGKPWAEYQYTLEEREEDRRNGAKGGQAKAAKSDKAKAVKSGLPPAAPPPPTGEPWPGAKVAFEKCWEAYKAPNRGHDREAAYRAFCDKVPNQAASDVLFEKIQLQNAEVSDNYRGFKFVNFLDAYRDFSPRPKAAPTGAQAGTFKVPSNQNSDYYGATGEQEI